MPPPKPIVAGAAGARPQPLAYHWSRTSGNQWTLTWRGLPKDVVGVPVSGASEIDYQQDAGGPLATLKATFQSPSFVPGGGVEVSQDTLELVYARQSISIFKNKTYAGISDEMASAIQGLVKDVLFQKAGETFAAFTARITSEETSKGIAAGSPEDRALRLMLRGTDSFFFFAPIMTLTRTVSPQFPSGLSTASVGKIISSAALAAYLNPEVVLIALNNISGNIAAPASCRLGWLKDARLQWTAMGSCQMIETFEFGAWETDLYENAAEI